MREQKIKRLLVVTPCLLVLVVMVFFTGLARSEYPERPVTILVGFEAGGAADLLTRGVVIGASQYLKQPIVVENKGGGGGSVALAVVATAKPDGYTLCQAPDVAIVDTALIQKVTYKPLKSFTPIIGIGAATHTALLVKNDAPWKTFDEFIDYAKRNPGKIKYGSAGVGTGMHVVMEIIAQKDGIKWVHVPYKSAVPARTALMGGHIDAVSSSIDWPPFVQSGQLKVLATHGEKRSPYFPDVPTLKEMGYNAVNFTVQAIVGPAGLPPEVVKKLEAAFVSGMETPEFKAVRERLYMSPVSLNSKEYDQYLKEKWGRTEKLFKETGIIKEAATQPY
jgi:tripartite-type tricarboxylate transporter receptor subunit TctC